MKLEYDERHMNIWDEESGGFIAHDVMEEHGRLFEAAPDLLNAAVALVANLEEGDFISTTRIDAVKAAIAKAKGQAQ